MKTPMENLTIKELSPYLDVNLLIHDKAAPDTLLNLTELYNDILPEEFWKEFGKTFFEQVLNDKMLKSLMLPISALTEEIEGVGIPIIELAKIAFPGYENYELENGEVKIGNGIYFSLNVGDFYAIEHPEDGENWDSLNVPYQLALFQKLAEMHIDYQNLIGRGLAIDKRTIKTY